MKTVIFIIGMCLCCGLIPLTSLAETIQDGKGIIMQFSLEDRNIMINDKQYALDDRLQVINKFNIGAGDRSLQNGQTIEFWLDRSNTAKHSVPSIKRIRILSEVKMNY